jgi:hypothetical protein
VIDELKLYENGLQGKHFRVAATAKEQAMQQQNLFLFFVYRTAISVISRAAVRLPSGDEWKSLKKRLSSLVKTKF